ncbi:MAG: YraN family protein [Oscillospiraceae bacterium]|nr:YraN family protein [Oscillospiraceae bacterium]
MTPAESGKMGELAVGYYLEYLGYRILDRNFRIRGGEIDLIAVRNDEICFVEVKTRKLHSAESGAEAVNRRKQRLLIRAAYRYLEEKQLSEDDWYFRYDIAEVITLHDRIVDINYLENAFDETDFHDNSQNFD